MNLLLFEPGELSSGGEALLAGRRAEHLRKVLRVEPGRVLRAGVLGGGRGRAEVLAAGPEGVRLYFELADESPAPPPWADLILALPRPAVVHRLLQTAAAMGIGRLDLVRSWRVEKSFFSSPALRPATIREHLVLGAEQGMVTRLPEVRVHRRLVTYLEDLGPAPAGSCRLLAHPAAELHLEEGVAAMEPASGRPAVLAIGPEGGWIDREVESFRALGFRPVRLGPWVLRVEAAAAVALGQLALAGRRAPRPG